ncbi:MAG: 2TM domain-containing protein [Pseudomonadota bacterium]
MDNDIRLRKQVQRLAGFYRHLAVYLLVNGGLLLINLMRSPGEYWVVWPLAGWGMAVAIHGLSVFFGGRFPGAEWQERQVRRLAQRDRARRR